MIERTFDFRRVNRLTVKPPIISNELLFLVENVGNQDIGLWTLHHFENGFMIHADLGIQCRGLRAIQSARRAFQWIFENSRCKFIYALIPKNNRPACQIAVKSGMEFIKELPKGRFFKVEKNG